MPKPAVTACGTEKTADVKDIIHSAIVLRLEDWIVEAIPTPPAATKMIPHQIPSPVLMTVVINFASESESVRRDNDSSATCINERLHTRLPIKRSMKST